MRALFLVSSSVLTIPFSSVGRRSKQFTYIISLIVSIFIQTCSAETAQPIIIPGYDVTSTPTPSTPSQNNPPKNMTQTVKKEIPATPEELQQLITTIDLSGWSTMASYLWTCTPSYFNLPMYNAKNDIQVAFNQVKEKKQILTKASATQLANKIGQPVEFIIPGLMGISCRFNIAVSNVEKPYHLRCFFIMLEARYLAKLSILVSENNEKPTLLPEDTVSAIQNLLDTHCTKEPDSSNISR